MKKLITSMVLAAGLAMPASASFSVVTGNPAAPVADNNDFAGAINGWAGGSADFFAGAGLSASGAGTVDFYFMASESSWNATFTADGGAVSFTENTLFTAWAPVTWIGSMNVGGGVISDLHFSSNSGPFTGGSTADVGVHSEFGIFTMGGKSGHEYVLLAFDDNGAGPDDNHDDLIILAKFTAAIPEPATWLMMIMGFGLAGLAARRREQSTGKLPA